MKRFLLLTSILSICLLTTLAIGEYIVRHIPNPYNTKHHWMQQHADSIEMLILGSSHAYYGINPLYLKAKSYNLANISQPYRYDYYLLTHYARHYQRLHTVILPVSYFSFFLKGFEEEEWQGNINYKIYMECPYYPDISKYNLELSNLEVFRGKLQKAINGEPPRNCSALGWGNDYTSDTKKDNWEDTAPLAVAHHTATYRKYIGENIRHFEQIALFCKEHDIRLILVTTPTRPAYHNLLDTKQLTEMYEIIDSVKQRYNLTYKDYLKDPRFTAEDFWDSDHLSDIGAEKFTRLLQTDISSLP